jgi:catechol 2,3-dioxygenase-like lactoylglutathione lyase family enzyme
MSRGLDHIVHAVRDLERAAEFYRRLGFTVGARNRQPREWGTQNHIIQTPDTFIELLAVVDDSNIAPHGTHYFSFGAFNRDFLQRGEGLSMLVLKGRGAPDAGEFHAKGIGNFEIYEFEREGKRPDGTRLSVSFALAFASDPHAPDAGFFTCQHRHAPENFWNLEFQKHANGVTATAGVVLVAREPQEHQAFMEAFVGGQAKRETTGFSIATPRGVVEMTTPEAFTRRYGVVAPEMSRGARLAAVRFVADKGAVIGPDEAMGAVIVFEPAR